MRRGYPDINFFDDTAESLVSDYVTIYESLMQRTLHPADPLRMVFSAIAGATLQTIESFNFSGKQNFPRFAVGEFLDSLAEVFYKVGERLEAKRAETTLRFTVTSSEDAVMIPEGSAVSTVDGRVVFVTTQMTSVPPGETEARIPAECMVAGIMGNGFVPGQICRIVGEPFNGFVSVENVTETAGGSEAEDDDAYYERMRLSMEGFSTAGPTEGYEFFARSASVLVSDAKATTPAPGEVMVRILLQGGELPGEEILRTVEKYLSDRTKRPLTDHVAVGAPEVATFDVEFTYWLPAVSSKPAEVAREDIRTATDEYILWQRSQIGRDINPSKLYGMLMAAGARRLKINQPVFRVLDDTTVAVPGTIKVHDGGIEHD